jgi:hypothetical protein
LEPQHASKARASARSRYTIEQSLNAAAINRSASSHDDKLIHESDAFGIFNENTPSKE